MDTASLERLDSFPYRHRVAELMATPLVSLPAHATVADAARLMSERRISSVVVPDAAGRLQGILTERDVLRLVARDPRLVERPIDEAMSRPVQAIAADALVYRALARMARLGVRHLPAVDAAGRPVGMLTAGALLKQRASLALTVGDEIEHASDAAALRAAHDKLPALAAALRREDAPAAQISAVIAAVVCDLTARAGELALARMRAEGSGEPPARWCLLVLGSAGRGESLLAADQDNALVHDGESRDDAWFLALGERLNALLDAAGIPLCTGGVMAGRPAFCRSLASWRDTIDGWVAHPRPDALMNVDIFYDFVPVLGDRDLAGELRRHAADAAAGSAVFLRLMAHAGEQVGRAFDVLGRLRTDKGRIDLKRQGLFPIVAAARAIALAWRALVTGTDARLQDAAARGALPTDSAADLVAARATLVAAILDQQLADLEHGGTPGNRVEPRRLRRPALRDLRHALEIAATAPDAVRGALTARAPERMP
jgi:CBS domain-containing protein